MRHFKPLVKSLGLIAMVLLSCAMGIAQVLSPRKDSESMRKSEQPTRPRTDGPAITLDNTTKYSVFHNNPCTILTRDELEAILKRSETDRALVSVSEAAWYDNDTEARCGYFVKYEERIFPDDPADNSLSVRISFNNEHAKQGKLVIDPNKDPFEFRRYTDSDFDMRIVTGVGDEALYFFDKSRFKYENRRSGTAGGAAVAYQHYDNGDFLYVRKKQLLVGFRIKRIVAGGSDPTTVIQIARKAMERVP